MVLTLALALHAQDLSQEEMRADLRQMAAVVERAWAYYDDKKENFGVDVAKTLAEMERRLDSVKTRKDFTALLEEFIGSLQDGHAWVHVPNAQEAEGFVWPFRVVDAREGLLIDRFDSSLGKECKIARGDRLVAVDGESVERRIESASRRVPASTPGVRRAGAIRKIHRTEAKTIRVTLEHPEGRTYETVLKTVPARPPETLQKLPFLTCRRLDNDTGYLRVFTFQPDPDLWSKTEVKDREAVLAPYKKEIQQAFAEIGASKALILDLRGNGGGTDWLGMSLAQHLLTGGAPYFGLQTRYSPELAALPNSTEKQTNGWSPKGPPLTLPTDKSVSPYPGKLVLVIDEGCFSTTDNFVACVADQHSSVRLVGRPTGGGTGAPRLITTLKNSKAEVGFCVMKVYRPHGEIIEGRGTRPHVEVLLTRKDLLENRDPDLEAAILEAKR